MTLGKVALFVAFMLIVGRRVFPWMLWQVARTGSRELFTLCVIAAAVGIALVSPLLIPGFGSQALLDLITSSDRVRIDPFVSVRASLTSNDPHDLFTVQSSVPAYWRMVALPNYNETMEIMAEAIAAYAGCRSLRRTGRRAAIGLLLGIRDYRSEVARFAPGARLIVETVRVPADEWGKLAQAVPN